MTKQKWEQIYENEVEKMNEKFLKINNFAFNDVENWPTMKSAMVEFVKTMDDATEVYNLENKGN